MKLYFSPTSPYVRKVLACAITHGLDGRIQRVPTNPHLSPPELIADNPLSRIPCLVTEDGLALFDSPVICEYLDEITTHLPLFPPKGAARWAALRLQALGDGMLDAAVSRRGEQNKPQDTARDATMARQAEAVRRSLDMLEANVPANHLDIGTIAIACALGYLDFRFAHEDWRGSRPRLAAWFERMSEHACLRDTAPRDAA